MSNRQRKKKITQEVKQLKQQPGWNPATLGTTSAGEQLETLNQDIRTHKTYAQNKSCESCVRLREHSDDSTALCEKHLAQTLGF